MDQLDEMLEQFKDFASLQKFAEAQQNALQTLSKKVKQLEEENSQLKLQQDTTPKSMIQIDDLGYGSDEEVISKIQLARLKEVSMERELTLEEAKRVEIFSKIILSKEKNKTFDFSAKKVDSTDLLKMIENESGSEH